MVLKGLEIVQFDPMKNYLVYSSTADRAVLNCILRHVFIESVNH